MTEKQLVWFKRDLRLLDHAPLSEAVQRGPCILLYVYEPELLQSAEFDSSHLEFIHQSLEELERGPNKLGSRLTIRLGNLPGVFQHLYEEHPLPLRRTSLFQFVESSRNGKSHHIHEGYLSREMVSRTRSALAGIAPNRCGP